MLEIPASDPLAVANPVIPADAELDDIDFQEMSGCSDADDNAMKRFAAEQNPEDDAEDAPDADAAAEPATKKKRTKGRY